MAEGRQGGRPGSRGPLGFARQSPGQISAFHWMVDLGGPELRRGWSAVGSDLESIWTTGMSAGLMWLMVCGLSGQAGWLSFSFEP